MARRNKAKEDETVVIFRVDREGFVFGALPGIDQGRGQCDPGYAGCHAGVPARVSGKVSERGRGIFSCLATISRAFSNKARADPETELR